MLNDKDNFDDKNEIKEQTDVEKKKKYSKGFYIAFTFCLLAMAAAAYITYSSVTEYMQPQPLTEISTSAKQNEKKAGANLSGVEKDSSQTQKDALSIQETEPETQLAETAAKPDNEAATQPTDAAAESNQAELKFPAGKEVVKNYSDSTPVYSKTLKDWRVHNAVDFKAENGSTINAIDDGIVLEITTDGMYGTTIAIEHNSGFTAYYSNVKPQENIAQGSHVSVGDVLGAVQEIPCEKSDGAHLHIAVMQNGESINPLSLLNKEDEN